MASANTTSSSETGFQFPQYEQPNYLARCLPLAVIIVLANGLVFVLFGRTSSIRSPANIFLLSLAVCDFLNGIVNIPLFLTTSLNTSKPFPSLVYRAVPAVQHFTVVSTSYHILAITGERYIAITKPFRRLVIMTSKIVISCVGGIWVISGVVLTIHLLLDPYSEAMFVYDLTSVILTFLIPFITMACAYGVMFNTLRKRRNIFIQRQNSREKRRIRSEMRCLIIFISMLAIFAICWSPWFIIKILSAKSYDHDLGNISNIYIVVRYMSSAINPILYTLFKNDFRQAWRSMSKKFRKQGRDIRSRDTLLLTSSKADQRKHQASSKV